MDVEDSGPNLIENRVYLGKTALDPQFQAGDMLYPQARYPHPFPHHHKKQEDQRTI